MRVLLTMMAIMALTFTSFGQREMTTIGNAIYIDSVRLSLTDAAMTAMILSPEARSVEANEHFKQARRLGRVTKLMTIAGLWQMITGTAYIALSPEGSGVAFGTLKYGIGSVLVTTKLVRMDEHQHILKGVEAYNRALTNF